MDSKRIISTFPAPANMMVVFNIHNDCDEFSLPVLCLAQVEIKERKETFQCVLPMIASEMEGIILVDVEEYDDLTLNGKSCTHV
ncbi:MAG: hypothetical protein JRG71_05595 [Deltaproteobacteria bacterium]|nr:hypothetical protein [Deltaproteobacteria bacterium]